MKKILHMHTSEEASDAGREVEEEGTERSARFAPEGAASPAKKKGKKEVRVQEPASEDGEEKKAKLTSVKKTHKTTLPPVRREDESCVCVYEEGWGGEGKGGRVYVFVCERQSKLTRER